MSHLKNEGDDRSLFKKKKKTASLPNKNARVRTNDGNHIDVHAPNSSQSLNTADLPEWFFVRLHLANGLFLCIRRDRDGILR